MSVLKKDEFCDAIEQIRDFYDFTEALKQLKGVEEFPKKEKFIDSYLRTLIAAMDDVETEDNFQNNFNKLRIDCTGIHYEVRAQLCRSVPKNENVLIFW